MRYFLPFSFFFLQLKLENIFAYSTFSRQCIVLFRPPFICVCIYSTMSLVCN